MKTVSKGIVLRTLDYSDTSVIARVFTDNQGLKSFLLRGVKGKRKRTGYLQPLSLVEVEYHLHPRRDLLVANNVRHLDSYQSIPDHPHKRMVAMFLAEVLGNTIQSDHIDAPLFEYIHARLLMFDIQDWHPNFHLAFLAGMTRFLGIYPLLCNQPACFDIENGAFSSRATSGQNVLQGEDASTMFRMFTEPWEESDELKMDHKTRGRLTHALVEYYLVHATGMRPVKSLDILSEVLHD